MNPTRFDQRSTFLSQTDWRDATIHFLAQDASFRSYQRLEDPKTHQTAILMDAPPPYESVDKFLNVTNLLGKTSVRAPKILAVDTIQGFLILEDFGDMTYTKCLNAGMLARPLYEDAVDVLSHLHMHDFKGDLSSLARYDQKEAWREVTLFFEWYLPCTLGAPISEKAKSEFLEIFERGYHRVSGFPQTLVLRDYHVDNLMRVKDADAQDVLGRCGVLDYQDACVGPLVYDLVSLLEDVRRDVDPDLKADLIARYKAAFSMIPWRSDQEFEATYAFWSLQRNLKILGIFTRLALRDKKTRYLNFIKRTWRLIEQSLTAPLMKDFKEWLHRHIPEARRKMPSLPGPKTAFVMAAGLGKRLRPLTDTTPKPLLFAGQNRVIDCVLNSLSQGNVSKVVVNTHHLGDQVQTYLRDNWAKIFNDGIEFSPEETLLETAGGALFARPKLGEKPYFCLASDLIWKNVLEDPLLRLARTFDPETMDALLLLTPTRTLDNFEIIGYEGVGDYFRDSDGKLTHRNQSSEAPYVYSGLQILHHRFFEDVDWNPQNPTPLALISLYNQAQERGRLYGTVMGEGTWLHLVDLAAYQKACEFLAIESNA